MKQRFRDLVGVLCTGGRLRLWLVQHGPCADSENPASLIYSIGYFAYVLSQLAQPPQRWGLLAGDARIWFGTLGVFILILILELGFLTRSIRASR